MFLIAVFGDPLKQASLMNIIGMALYLIMNPSSGARNDLANIFHTPCRGNAAVDAFCPADTQVQDKASGKIASVLVRRFPQAAF